MGMTAAGPGSYGERCVFSSLPSGRIDRRSTPPAREYPLFARVEAASREEIRSAGKRGRFETHRSRWPLSNHDWWLRSLARQPESLDFRPPAQIRALAGPAKGRSESRQEDP